MKKFFTLIAAALFAVSVNADEVSLWEGSETITGWSGVTMLTYGGVELKSAGAMAGDEARFYITAAQDDWQLQVIGGQWGDPFKVYAATALTSEAGEPLNNEIVDLSQVDYVSLTLTQEILDHIYGLQYWGGSFILNGDGGIVCTKITLVRPVSYSDTAKTITFNESGFIAASEFEGLHDRAKVVFTYNIAVDPGSKKGWGVGRVCSNDDTDGNPTVELATLPADAAGDASVTVTYADIKTALAVTPDGILFNIWGFEDVPATRVKVEAFDAIEDSGSDEPGEGGDTEAATLIDYPTSQAGIAAVAGGTAEFGTVKIHENKDEVAGIKFANSKVANGVELTVEGGFKAGDQIVIAGAFNNSDDTKVSMVDICVKEGADDKVLFTTQQFINGRTTADEPVVETYTLEADADVIYLARNGGTTTFVTLLKVVRGGTTGIQEIPVKVISNGIIYNLAGQKVDENYKGIVIKNGKKYFQK